MSFWPIKRDFSVNNDNHDWPPEKMPDWIEPETHEWTSVEEAERKRLLRQKNQPKTPSKEGCCQIM